MWFNSVSYLGALTAVLGLASAAPSTSRFTKRGLSFDYQNQKLRGVNLGGWLVLEPWITPSLFERYDTSVVDEYTLTRKLGKDAARNYLKPHWDSFITADDFRQIKEAGLNHVRIPVGYWAVNRLDDDPYVDGQLEYLDKAIGWARQHGLKVWVDLHGAPGSQNGFDNSGKRDGIQWQQGNNVKHTLGVLRTLFQRYGKPENSDVVTAIELLNEPLGPNLDMNQIRQFNMDGWGLAREVGSDFIPVAISDAFQPLESWNGFMTSGWNNVIIDAHHYQVFTPGLVAMNHGEHIGAACGYGWSLRGLDKWTIVGEWSGAWTDCAKYLNGYGRGIRYEGSFEGSWKVGDCGAKHSGKVAQLSGEEKSRLQSYLEAQVDAYEQANGWFFWTWKTEGAPEWDMQDLLQNNIFPRPGSNWQYPNQCGF